jgi:hypothetical protein
MVKCTFANFFSVDAPSLMFVQCIAPESWVPVFKNFGVLVTGSVMLDDSLLSKEFKKYQEDNDEYPRTTTMHLPLNMFLILMTVIKSSVMMNS